MTPQPTGVVTFLFTDVEGSTELLQQLGVERYARVLEDHHRLLRDAFRRHGGHDTSFRASRWRRPGAAKRGGRYASGERPPPGSKL